jgi:hypothetical protein
MGVTHSNGRGESSEPSEVDPFYAHKKTTVGAAKNALVSARVATYGTSQKIMGRSGTDDVFSNLKTSIVLFLRREARSNGIRLYNEISEMLLNPFFNVYVCLPFSISPAKSHSNLTRTITRREASVASILARSNVAKIEPPVIKTETRPMVHNLSASRGENNGVHVDDLAGCVVASRGVVGITPLASRIPFPLIQKNIIRCIDNGDQAFCEGDKTVRFRRRHNILFAQVGHSQPSTAGLMCRHFTLKGGT